MSFHSESSAHFHCVLPEGKRGASARHNCVVAACSSYLERENLMVGRLASRVTNAFDAAPADDAETVLPDWNRVKVPERLDRIAVSEKVFFEALDHVYDVIESRGGEAFGMVYSTVRLNPYSVVVTMVACSPYFGVQTLGRVAFDPDEVKLVVTDSGKQEVRLADE